MILVTYDISGNHSAFKSFLKNKNYSDKLGNANLPNTTLVKDGISTQQGLQDLRDAATHATVTLERAMAVDFNSSTWTGITGNAHS